MGAKLVILVSFTLMVLGAIGIFILYGQDCDIGLPTEIGGIPLPEFSGAIKALFCQFSTPWLVIGTTIAGAALAVGTWWFFRSIIDWVRGF